MYSLPTSIEIDNHHFGITNKGDYRMVIDCFLALNDADISAEERTYAAMIIFYEDVDDLDSLFSIFNTQELFNEALKKMYDFFNCGQKEIGAKSNYKLVDWEQDEQIIVSAINNVAHQEVRAVEYLHWFTFMGYYTSIGESVMSTVVSIRDKIVKNKKLEDYEKEFRRENPEYFNWNYKTVEEQALDKEVFDMWNSGK